MQKAGNHFAVDGQNPINATPNTGVNELAMFLVVENWLILISFKLKLRSYGSAASVGRIPGTQTTGSSCKIFWRRALWKKQSFEKWANPIL